jgi:periplasmic divalent cation tolerance protein
MKMLAVWTTVATEDDARRIARLCVEQRLAACVQWSRIDSCYEWKGQVQQEPEIRIVLKTTDDRYAALEAALRQAHPYELPAIFAFDVAAASAEYCAWVEGQTQEPSA